MYTRLVLKTCKYLLTVALGRADGADGRVVPAAEEGNDDEDDHAGHRRDCHLHHTVGAQ